MSKLFLGKINLSKIDKERLYKGERGTWLDVAVWLNDKEDQYGQIASIEQSTKKGEDKIYIGNLKEYKATTEQSSVNTSDPAELETDDDFPF